VVVGRTLCWVAATHAILVACRKRERNDGRSDGIEKLDTREWAGSVRVRTVGSNRMG
jgi:hypothetical protein